MSVLSQHLRGTPQVPALQCHAAHWLFPGWIFAFLVWLLALGPDLISFPSLPPALGWKEDGQVAVDAQCQQDHDSG